MKKRPVLICLPSCVKTLCEISTKSSEYFHWLYFFREECTFMPQLQCYHTKNWLIQGVWYFQTVNTAHFPYCPICLATCLATWPLHVEVDLKSTQKPKQHTISVCNIMNNEIKCSVIQLWQKRITILDVDQAGQTTVVGPLPLINNSGGFPLVSFPLSAN